MTKVLFLLILFLRGAFGALFVYHITPQTEYELVFELFDPKLIKQAQEIIATNNAKGKLVMGNIIKKKAPYNPRWSFHLGIIYKKKCD